MLGLMGFSGSLPLYVIHRYYIFVFIDRANKDACLLTRLSENCRRAGTILGYDTFYDISLVPCSVRPSVCPSITQNGSIHFRYRPKYSSSGGGYMLDVRHAADIFV